MAKKVKSKHTLKKVLVAWLRMFGDIFSASKLEMSVMMAIIICVSVLPLANNLVVARLIDELIAAVAQIPAPMTSGLLILFALYVAVELISSILWALNSYLERKSYFRITQLFTFRFLRKTSLLDLYHYEDAKQNDLIQKASESYNWRPANASNRFIWTLSSIVEVVTSVSVIAVFSPFFFFIVLVSVIPSAIVAWIGTDDEWGIWGDETNNRRTFWAGANFLSRENSLMELRIFGTLNYIFDLLKGIHQGFHTKQMHKASRRAFLQSFTTIFSKMGILGFWLFAMYEVLNGRITVGSLTFYTAALTAFSRSFENFVRNLAYMYEDAKYMTDFYMFIDLENKIVPGKRTLSATSTPPTIEFKNVDFSYPDSEKPTLVNFNLTINPGEKIAFVGENGAGKSTIIKLLARFYDVSGGQILIDGHDLRDLDTDAWYAKLGVLFQNFVNYEFLSAGKNIALGDVTKIDNQDLIEQAAIKAGADKVIQGLAKGYDQLLSKHYEGGVDLSGGQWQRIALARGFFRDAPVLVLDEPTSAIDAKAEYEIFERLYEFAANKTVVIVSHRFSTVRRADKIYVIDQGRIVEAGSHDELTSLNGIYKNAFDKQASGYK